MVFSVRLTNEEIDSQLVGRDLIRVGEYVGNKVKILFRCLKCATEWESTTNYVISKNKGCPKCDFKRHKVLTNDIVDARVAGRPLERVGDFKSVWDIRWRCTALGCGYEWNSPLSNITYGGSGCAKCSKHNKLTNEEFDRRISHRNIERLGNVSGASYRVTCRCKDPKCLYIWTPIATDAMNSRNKLCPKCAKRGFRQDAPAVLYVYDIDDSICGYGISNDFIGRNKVHETTFRNGGVTGKVIATFECGGTTALRIEGEITDSFPRSGTKLRGFKRESTPIVYLPKVLDFINRRLKELNV